MFVLVHALDFSLGPDTLVVVGAQLGSRRSEPPEEVDTKGKLGVVEEVLLLSVLLLQIVHIALVVID